MTSPTQITVAQLMRKIGLPDAPVLIDVCIDEDFAEDPRYLPSALRHPHLSISELVPILRNQKVVVVCHKGLKLSQGSAAILRHHGIDAETLEGGRVAWADAGAPMVPVVKLPKLDDQGRTVWVTRQRPKIDRIACPWLIRRFVDPRAQFLFVEGSQVEGVAEKFGATPFDVEGVFWTHRGDKCTFDTMVEELGLSTEPLERLANVVRAADTNRHDLAPQAAGLMAASLGLSRMFRDDLEQLNAGMVLYDAFYRWCRDATGEVHDWPGVASR